MLLHHASCGAGHELKAAQHQGFNAVHSETKANAKVHVASMAEPMAEPRSHTAEAHMVVTDRTTNITP